MEDRREDFFICGPAGMMADLRRDLAAAGVPDERLHTESFAGADGEGAGPAAATAAHEVTFARSQRTLAWAGEYRNLLEFAESNGVPLDAGCMFGECGACSTRLVAGEVDYNYATASQPKPGHCLPCSCRPRTAITLDA